MEENKVYAVITYDGTFWNVEANDIIDAAVKAGDELGARNIFQIVDIPG